MKLLAYGIERERETKPHNVRFVPFHIISIWANYYNSQTLIKGILVRFPYVAWFVGRVGHCDTRRPRCPSDTSEIPLLNHLLG